MTKVAQVRKRAPNRGGRSSADWGKYLYELSKELSPVYAEIGGVKFGAYDDAEGGRVARCESLAEVAARLLVAKADLALLHVHQAEEARRVAREAAAELKRQGIAPPPRAKATPEVLKERKEKRKAADASRRAAAKIEAARVEAARQRKRTNDKASAARRAAAKVKP